MLIKKAAVVGSVAFFVCLRLRVIEILGMYTSADGSQDILRISDCGLRRCLVRYRQQYRQNACFFIIACIQIIT